MPPFSLAKHAGGGRAVLYRPEIGADAQERLALAGALRHALERGEFALHFQPIVAVDDGALVAVEALVRWAHPTRGLLLPGAFLPVAEETGLLAQLGDWLLRTACQQIAAWRRAGRTGRRQPGAASARSKAR